MNGKKILVLFGMVSFLVAGLNAGKARYMDSLNVAHKARVGAGLTVNGGADINGPVNVPQGPLNVMNKKLYIDPSGVSVNGQLKVNGQSVGGTTGSFPAPFEVKKDSTSLFRVDTNSSVNVGKNTSPNAGTVSLGNNASQVQIGNNCSTIQIGKSGSSGSQISISGKQIDLNATVKVNGQSIGTGGGSGTVKGTFEVKNSGGTSTFFKVDGSSGDAQFSQDLTVNGKTTLQGDTQLKGQLLDEHGNPIEFGGGTSGEVIGEFTVKKNAEAQPVFGVIPDDQSAYVAGDFRVKIPGGDALLEVMIPRQGNGSVVVNGDTTLNGMLKLDPAKLTDMDENPIELGGGGANEVIGSFMVKPSLEAPAMFEVNPDGGTITLNGSLIDGDGKPIVGGMKGSAFGQMAAVTFDKDVAVSLISITSLEEGTDPMLVDLVYLSDTDSFNLNIVLTNGETPTATIVGGFAKIGGTVVSDVTLATNFEAAYDGSIVSLTLKTGSSTGSGVLFFRVFGNSLSDATAYVS